MPGLNVPLPGHGPVLVAGVVAALCPSGRPLDPGQQAVLDAIRSAFREGVGGEAPGSLPAVDPLPAVEVAAVLTGAAFFLIGSLIMAYNLWRTAKGDVRAREFAASPALAPAE